MEEGIAVDIGSSSQTLESGRRILGPVPVARDFFTLDGEINIARIEEFADIDAVLDLTKVVFVAKFEAIEAGG